MPLFGKPDVRKLEQRRDIKGLIKALKHRDESVRSDAAEALGRIGEEAINPLIQELRRLAPTQKFTAEVLALAKIGEPAVEPLIRAQAAAAATGNVGVLAYIAVVSGQVLRQIGQPGIKPLIGMLSDPDANLRGLVSSFLGAMGQPAVEPLLGALADTRDEVRIGAAVALGLIGDGRAVESLGRALKDDNRWVRLHSAGALVKMDPSQAQAIQVLSEAAQDVGADSTDDYRGIATFYLKECGQKSVGIVQELLTLKSKISALPEKYPAGAATFGPGAGKAQEQIPTVCAVIDDAIKGLGKGLDVHNRPITRPQVSDGLKRLVAATRRPEFVGLISTALSADGIHALEKHMNELEQIASKIK